MSEPIEILYYPMTSPEDPRSRWPGYCPSEEIWRKGYQYMPGGATLPCDIIFQRDVTVTLEDGTKIDMDIYRPVTEEKVPVLLGWGSFGKRLLPMEEPPEEVKNHIHYKEMMENINADSVMSGLETRMGPDPFQWVQYGYAVANADPRGVYHSQGNMQYFGSQYGKDARDTIEFLARQEWCNGKVGISGTHWQAISAWFAAAEQPEHLAAIYLVEGHGHFYRDEMVRGGIPQLDWNNRNRSFGYGMIEDIAGMSEKYPLYNDYWADKDVCFEKVTCPVYLVPSFVQTYHSRGPFEGFNRIASKDKWMRVHNGSQANEYRKMANVADSRRFFDYFLKGVDNGWADTPRYRLGLLDPGHTDMIDRVVDAFPPAGYAERDFYLHPDGVLSEMPAPESGLVSYISDDGKDCVHFTLSFEKQMELVGYSALKLWVEAEDATDMDIFVRLDKLSPEGDVLLAQGTHDYAGPNGRLRVSHRKLDAEKSTRLQPFHTHREEALLTPGEIAPVEIGIWPTAMVFHPGEQLRLEISGHGLRVAHASDEAVQTRNTRRHILHLGGAYDTQLRLPLKEG